MKLRILSAINTLLTDMDCDRNLYQALNFLDYSV